MDFGMESTALIHKNMPLTRRKILMLLKEKGELTADELADLLGISAVAVRRLDVSLESCLEPGGRIDRRPVSSDGGGSASHLNPAPPAACVV